MKARMNKIAANKLMTNPVSNILHLLEIQWCIDDRAGLPDEDDINGWFQLCLNELHEQAAEVCLRIVNGPEIMALNLQYRDKTGATNVLSFPNDAIDESGRILLGDIVICSDVVVAEAENQAKSVEAHFAHLLIHGVLHLQGHDHSEQDQALEMEAIEIKLMESLGFGDPYE